MRLSLLIFIVLFESSLWAQIKPLKDFPFSAGEKVSYHALYEWGFIEIKAGLVEFSVDESHRNEQKEFLFRSIGNSLPQYDWIFKVRDTFQSRVLKANLVPVYYKRSTNEGDYQVRNETHFNLANQTIDMKLFNSDDGHRKASIKYEPGIFDLQTAVYFARLLDFRTAAMGETYTFSIIIDGELYKIPIRYEGKESLVLDNKTTYNCFRISTKLIEGTIFKSNQTITIWVSDDGRQIPVRVIAPIIVGTVKAELDQYIDGASSD